MKKPNGFTLVELVVVILILGILAAVAAPKLFDTSAKATDNGLKQSLTVVRDAIELYTAEYGTLPGQSNNLDTDLDPFLRGNLFPACPIGAKNNGIAYTTGPLAGDALPTQGWKYATDTGEFIANSNANTASDPTVQYDDL